ncbi:acyltransferase family protein [Bacteroides sp.]|uniref:acyltransferase family protein n=1 Tax=Bacteroides sp. TaxID=29523 RepID=UPI002628BC28|nr:acyltransferase family protein [Bacteroides sp.]MDD3040486.1 acyltransferase family protein [Bacteroides sp.]
MSEIKAGRLEYIDVARGIAMLCIVAGHLGIAEVNRVVFTFHIPIFYFITGYFLTTNGSKVNFVKKKFKTLIIPYLFSGLLVVAAAVAVNELWLGGDNSRQVMIDWLKAVLYGAGDNYTDPFYIKGIGATWFLLATFWGACFLRCIVELKKTQRIVVILMLFLVCSWSRSICWFPFSIQAGGCAVLFMYFGYLFRDIKDILKSLSLEVRIVLTLLAAAVWLCFMRDFQSFWLVHCDIGRGGVDILGSICGCSVLLLLS